MAKDEGGEKDYFWVLLFLYVFLQENRIIWIRCKK